jgi:hypothetical protein
MPSFLKDLSLRRRSKASFNTAPSVTSTRPSDQNSSSSNEANDEQRSQNTSNGNKSSSTLSSWFDRASPPTTLASSGKSHSSSNLPSMNGNGAKTPPLAGGRPGMPGTNNRYSLVVSQLRTKNEQVTVVDMVHHRDQPAARVSQE